MGIRHGILCLFVAASAVIGSSASVSAQCEPTVDCNGNGVLDFCDIAFGTSDDCNTNGIPDECDIAASALVDCNLNGIPDSCEPAADVFLTLGTVLPDGAGTAVATDGEHTISGFPLDETIGPDSGAAAIHRRVGTRWLEESFLLAIDGAAGDRFGSAVDIEGEWAVVGAPGAGINLQAEAGAVYIYRHVLGSWIPFQKITAPIPAASDFFGSSVGVSGTSLIVGAPQGELDLGTGRAFLFTFDGIAWALELDLTPGALEDGDRFGFAVSIDGPRAFASAPEEQGLFENNSGAIYAYERLGGIWLSNGRIISPFEQQNEHFGESLSVSGTRVAVGAPGRAGNDGGVHILTQTALTWSAEAVVSAPVAPDRFGEQISLHGESLIVGDNRRNGNSGVAYIFDRNGGAWSLRETRTPAGIVNGDRFGSAVALSERTAIGGASGLPGMAVLWVANPIDCDLNGIEDICDINAGNVPDCNLNGVPDSCDIADGTVADCDLDGIPDVCEIALGTELDCNGNGALDSCDLAQGATDCNANAIPDDCETDCDESGTADECDIALGLALDCNANGIPDSCDVSLGFAEDCNGNGIPDSCDLASGFSADCDLDGALDECAIAAELVPDCNGNGIPDSCDIDSGLSADCNGNGALDECDLASGLSEDCDLNQIPDECDFVAGAPDCNGNGVLDSCDIASELSSDCDGNQVPDECDIVAGVKDCNGNGVLDSCEVNSGIVIDATPPTITGLPESQVVSAAAGQCGAVVQWIDPIITDDCELSSVTQTRDSGEFFLTGVTTVTYVAIDLYGNSTTAAFTVTVRDLELPVTTGAPTDQLTSAPLGTCSAPVSFSLPTAADNCAVVSTTSSHESGAEFPVGDTLVEITTTDTSGNVQIDSFTVTVLDLEPPLLSGSPTSMTLANDPGTCGAIVDWIAPTATDNCPEAVLVASIEPGSFFPIGTTTVTYTVTDASGNEVSSSFDVTVEDSESPLLAAVPQRIDVENELGACGAFVTWDEPTTSDNCPDVSLESNATSGDFFPVGTTTVVYTATDASGLSVFGSFDVVVVDSEAPLLTGVPSDLALDTDLGTCGATVSWPEPTTSDNCPGVLLESNLAPRAPLPVGMTVVTYTATDVAGNSVSASFNVTVIDNELPTLADRPIDLVLSTDPSECGAVATWQPPTPSDPCGVAEYVESALPGSFFPVGVTTVDYSVTDLAGNVETASFTVTVTDDESPTWTDVPADMVLPSDPGQCSATVSWDEPSVSDGCGVASTSSDAVSGAIYPLGTTIVTYTATDAAGNVGEASFSVTIEDTEAPTLSGLPLDLELVSDEGVCGTIATWGSPTALDNCAGVTLSADFASGDFFPGGTTIVTYTASDVAGNETTGTFTVTVLDPENPVFTFVPIGTTATNDLGQCAGIPFWESPTATDNCGLASIEADPPLGSSFPVGVSTVTLTATDLSGNTATTTFEVTVTDGEAPVIEDLPASVSLGTDPEACGAAVAFALPTATDNCAVLSVVSSRASGSSFPLGETIVEFTATDTAGNTSTGSFTVTVSDLEAPLLEPSEDIAAPLDASSCSALVTVPAPSVIDSCDVAEVTNDFTGTSDASGEYPVGVTVVTWTASDQAGNESTATQTITVDAGEDCNGNGIPDACDIAAGSATDCNENGVPDSCDLTSGASSDLDGDGVPDDCQALFIRGDSNGDALVDIADGIFILNFLFLSGTVGTCADTLDANDDGTIQLSDAITVFGYMFSNEAPPVAPFEVCGVDPTADTLDCVVGSCP